MNATLLVLLFASATNSHHLPEGLLNALCFVESTHNVAAVHVDDGGGNSIGVCQVKFQTAKFLGYTGTEKQLMIPAVNIHYSAKYLSYQIKRYGSIHKAIIAYNSGHFDPNNTKYLKKVLKAYKQKR